MNKKSNKDRSLVCDRCKSYFDMEKHNMYAIGFRYGQVCGQCWEKTMQEVADEQIKTPKETERQFNLGGYDNQIYKSNTEKD